MTGNEKECTVVSKYTGNGKTATVYRYTDGSGYIVKMEEPGSEWTQSLEGRSEYYAEDLAENYVMGYGSFLKG